MKKCLLVILALLLMLTSVALAESFPFYGRCVGEKVNVRVKPDSNYPSYGRLIHDAPVTVTGEEGNTYYCSTAFGNGYIPKQYIERLDNMDYASFRQYCKDHPSVYSTTNRNKAYNKALLKKYYAGEITDKQLLSRWKGKAVFTRDSKGLLVLESE